MEKSLLKIEQLPKFSEIKIDEIENNISSLTVSLRSIEPQWIEVNQLWQCLI